MNDRELLDQYLNGEREAAFEELVRRYHRMVYATALRVAIDRQLAEDVSQNVFLTLCRKAATIPTRTVLSGWLFMTATHLARNARRAHLRQMARERDLNMAALQPSQSRGDSRESTWQEIQPHIDACIAALPPRQRDAVVMRLVLQRSPEECAAELKCSENALSMRLNRGVETLRARLHRKQIPVSASALSAMLVQNSIPESLPAAALKAGTLPAPASSSKTLTWVGSGAAAAAVTAAILVASLSLGTSLND
ncbi:MAG TPA: RNA polymerase sigma factor, partial [Planctomycetota bacterium]|nr:RNA polymerase sigma factor [Planctomycetota bacterium]